MASLVAVGATLGVVAAHGQPTVQSAGDSSVDHSMHHGSAGTDPARWRMPPMSPNMPMPPGLEGMIPPQTPFLPGIGTDPATVPDAVFREVVELRDGDSIDLEAGLVRRTINGRTFVMYGFNGQYPGPLIKAPEGATITVNFRNGTEFPTALHWHGVRLDNRFDGVPHLTQEPVLPGGTFEYRVFFRDAGIYWYHPHHREDITQDLGLYGNLLISSRDADYYSPVNTEELVMLDDILIDDVGLFPYGQEDATQALMGRFGNVLLVNGEPQYELEVRRGDVVRFYLTNVSNTRIFNVSFGGAPIKLVGSDVGLFEKEVWVESVPIAPAERYVVEVLFETAGDFVLSNRIQAIDHFRAEFVAHEDTLGVISVSAEPTETSHRDAFDRLRLNTAAIEEIDGFRRHFTRAPDHQLTLDVEIGALPLPLLQMMAVDTLYYPPVEWNDVMPEMNYHATGANVRWIMRDEATGRENMDIDWRFRVGDVVKIRVVNDPSSAHPMHHPMHLHGQRFLVVERDGVEATNLVWKDTALVPQGSTVDLLVEMSNPGSWMMHCHIAEHLETGMSAVFEVEG
ncbi:MAG: multicopper oxidase domain-containing protein [Gemmatimonas sp.]|nr:multicopper oxidase domain-containing protein [Gemmatimonas sp.]